MTKWVTTTRDYKYQGIEIKVSCDRANLCYSGFQSWDYEGDVEQELYNKLEQEVLGGPLNPKKIVSMHYSNRNLDNLIVVEELRYPPLNIKASQETTEKIKQFKARQIAMDKLIDLAWDQKLKERESREPEAREEL